MNTVCGNCGASVIEGSAACPVCGEPLFNLQGEPNRPPQYGSPQMGMGGQGYGGPPAKSGGKKIFAIIGTLGCLGVLAIVGIAGFLIYVGSQQNANSNRIEYNFNVSPSPRATPSPYATIPPPPNVNMPRGTGGNIISGGVLNGKAISKPAPVYPPIAKAAKASGTVVVQVTIDESGKVISAKAISGHPLLQAAAVQAAYQAQFTPTKLSGQPVKVTGVLTYVFEPQ